MKGYLDTLEDALTGVLRRPDAFPRVRVVFTGSREWPSELRHVIGELLTTLNTETCGRVTLAHGKARGADLYAHRVALSLGFRVVPIPVRRGEWDLYGGRAGHMRNARMLDEVRPHLVLATIWQRSRGATGCRDNALARGIPCVTVDGELALLPRGRAML